MAVRTTATEVAKIISDYDATIDLTPFIAVANHLVTKVCTNSAYDEIDLELIERWLTAHFYHIRETKPISERAGSVSETKDSKVDLYLNQTIYGQQALFIDYLGSLAAYQRSLSRGGRTVSLTWLGTTLTRTATT